MLTMILYDSIPVAEHFLVALFNSDFTHLSAEDYDLLDEWYDTLPDEAYFEVVTEDAEYSDSYISFQRDSVTGTLASCVFLNIYTPVTVH